MNKKAFIPALVGWEISADTEVWESYIYAGGHLEQPVCVEAHNALHYDGTCHLCLTSLLFFIVVFFMNVRYTTSSH